MVSLSISTGVGTCAASNKHLTQRGLDNTDSLCYNVYNNKRGEQHYVVHL